MALSMLYVRSVNKIDDSSRANLEREKENEINN
jgi:hypothetical protein